MESIHAAVAALDGSTSFKVSQFVRTFVYEMLPPGLNTLALLLAETLVFRHTPKQAFYAACARKLLSVPLVGPLAAVLKANTPEFNLTNLFLYPFENGFWACLILVAYSDDVRSYVTPLELVPIAALFVTRAVVLACKHAYLPVSYVGDAATLGMMYTPEFSGKTIASTLALTSWNDPNNHHLGENEDHDNHSSEFLRLELEAACVVADVRLDGIDVHVGSNRAAEAVRAMARGVGEQSAQTISASPEAVSAKELLASIIARHYGKPMPSFLSVLLQVLGAMFAFIFPACRAISGAPAFGATHLGKLACVSHLLYAWYGFSINMLLATSAAWDFRRRRNALESLTAMVTRHGDEVTTRTRSSRGTGNATATDTEEGIQAASEEGGPPSEEGGPPDDPTGPPRICIDVKNPSSALAWSLVRRATRKVGVVYMHRMNAYNAVFLALAITCTCVLQGLYYGVLAHPHRLVAAVGLGMVSLNISLLCSLAVFEASRINEAVPGHLMLLKREMVALAAELANATFDGTERENVEKQRRMEATLHLLSHVGAAVNHEERVQDPFVVFGGVTAGPGAITATVGILVSMLVVAVQRLLYLYDVGWSYSGHWGEFVAPPA